MQGCRKANMPVTAEVITSPALAFRQNCGLSSPHVLPLRPEPMGSKEKKSGWFWVVRGTYSTRKCPGETAPVSLMARVSSSSELHPLDLPRFLPNQNTQVTSTK